MVSKVVLLRLQPFNVVREGDIIYTAEGVTVSGFRSFRGFRFQGYCQGDVLLGY